MDHCKNYCGPTANLPKYVHAACCDYLLTKMCIISVVSSSLGVPVVSFCFLFVLICVSYIFMLSFYVAFAVIYH